MSRTFERLFAGVVGACIACWIFLLLLVVFPSGNVPSFLAHIGVILILLIVGAILPPEEGDGEGADEDQRPRIVRYVAIAALSADACFLLWAAWHGTFNGLKAIEWARVIFVHALFYPGSYWAIYWWHVHQADWQTVNTRKKQQTDTTVLVCVS